MSVLSYPMAAEWKHGMHWLRCGKGREQTCPNHPECCVSCGQRGVMRPGPIGLDETWTCDVCEAHFQHSAEEIWSRNEAQPDAEPPIPADGLVVDVLPDRARVVRGPDCWVGLEGPVMESDGDMAVLLLRAQDDGYLRPFVVRMPWACLVESDGPKKSE